MWVEKCLQKAYPEWSFHCSNWLSSILKGIKCSWGSTAGSWAKTMAVNRWGFLYLCHVRLSSPEKSTNCRLCAGSLGFGWCSMDSKEALDGTFSGCSSQTAVTATEVGQMCWRGKALPGTIAAVCLDDQLRIGWPTMTSSTWLCCCQVSFLNCLSLWTELLHELGALPFALLCFLSTVFISWCEVEGGMKPLQTFGWLFNQLLCTVFCGVGIWNFPLENKQVEYYRQNLFGFWKITLSN